MLPLSLTRVPTRTVLAAIGLAIAASTFVVPAAGAVTFAPTADTRVMEANPATVFGKSTVLRTTESAGAREYTYLKFNVAGLSGAVVRAKLRLYATSATTNGPFISPLLTSAWSESTTVWSNRPGRDSGTQLADKGAISASTWVEFDITQLVKGDGTVSIGLMQTTSDAVSFASREATNKPQLVVTTEQVAEPDSGDLCARTTLPDPMTGAYPNASNTGVPSGTTLTKVFGDYHTKYDGEIVSRLEISGTLYIDHSTVKVRCSRIWESVYNRANNLQMWSTTIGNPKGYLAGASVRDENYRVRRLNIMGGWDGFKAQGNVEIRDSFIHDLWRTRDPSGYDTYTHNDGIQINGGSDIQIIHNTCYCWSMSDGQVAGANWFTTTDAGYMTSFVMISPSVATVRNVQIEDNLLRGRTAKYVLISASNNYTDYNVNLINNKLGRECQGCPTKPFGSNERVTIQGNVWFDTLQPIGMSQAGTT